MIIGKRLKRLWTQLTTGKVFHEDGYERRRCAGHPGIRVGDYLGVGSRRVVAVSMSIRTNAVAVPEVLVVHAEQKFDEGCFTDEVSRCFVRELLDNLLRAVAASMAGKATA